ncbi:hypothetical protein SH591_08630 [Sphingomonas sp. LY54]|uniref:hypothetical protein n=1 Tax=Sphingomonas sp. LY54 TaxID=3095343 RepID=UPI002D784BC6|nr:hypothetical protein [Sphingomonas sp. LY54]WRP27189.1 hypothetical protein SH591_08630 [Sphingomonas sp. LY54]
MARAAKLKVFRLPIGFHDAYVAAPSQKAAAEAWGTDSGVFARKEAELVTDPALTEAPLASPGQVIKRLRGTAAEQIAALGEGEPADVPRRKPGSSSGARSGPRLSPGSKEKPKPPPKPKPRPSRAKLDDADAALAAAEGRYAAELKGLGEREAALARERKALEARQDKERARLAALRETEEAAYREAMRRWREG